MKLWPFGKKEKRGTFRNPSDWMWEAFGAQKSVAGVNISEKTALQIASVWACVRLISETVASLPLNVYKRTETGKELQIASPLQRILHDQPNADMTAMVFRETLQAHALTWGNGYAEIARDNAGKVSALYPITPDRVRVEYRDEMLWYIVQTERGQVLLRSDEMFHLPAFGFDGLVGYSPIRMARESLGLARAAEVAGASFFGNGSRTGGVLQHPGSLSDEAFERLRKAWSDRHAGPENTGRVAILEEGMTYSQTSIPPQDAQYLETRVFQVQEICRWFNVPPHKVQELSHATFSNIEHQSIDFVTGTIRPWLVRWEQEIKRKLVSQPSLFAEHNAEGLLRGDLKSRYDAYAIGRNWGWLSVNDIRSLENLNAVEDGDIYLQPLNMVEAGAEPPPETPQEPPQEPNEEPADSPIEEPSEDSQRSLVDPARLSEVEWAAARRISGKEGRMIPKLDPKEAAPTFAKHREWIAEVLLVDDEKAGRILRAMGSLPPPTDETMDSWRETRAAQIIEVLHEA